MQYLKKKIKRLNFYFQNLKKKIYLSDWFNPIYDKYTDWVRVPLDNIKRIIAYIPILWKTREWDFCYTAQMWKFSLERLEKGMKGGSCVHTPKKLRKMKIAQNLLSRISLGSDFYEEMRYKEHYKKWGRPKIDFVEEKEDERWGKLYRIIDHREKSWTPEQKKEELQDRKKIHKEAKKLRKRDIELLAKILETQASGWWD